MTTSLQVRDAELQIANATTEELRAELASALKLTASHIMRLALIWGELERRGEDLSALRNGIGKYLPQIAAGHLLAETLVAFAGEPALLSRAAKLPIPEQKIAVQAGRLPEIPRQRVDSAVRSHRVIESPPRHASGDRERPAIRIEDMAKAASPKDVAEMCMEMIQASCDPKEVATRLMPIIEGIVGETMADDDEGDDE